MSGAPGSGEDWLPGEDWRPTATPAALRQRAALLARTREFFAERGVLEVETPALSCAGVSDPQIESLVTRLAGVHRPLYLHTSPEFPMKRLLAAGSGDIYQLCRVFRDGEHGRWHNPEFTLLEWYRLGFDDAGLMSEVEALAFWLAHRPHIRSVDIISTRFHLPRIAMCCKALLPQGINYRLIPVPELNPHEQRHSFREAKMFLSERTKELVKILAYWFLLSYPYKNRKNLRE